MNENPNIQTTGRVDPVAQVLDNAQVLGRATLLRNVILRDEAVAKDSAILLGSVEVSGEAVVGGRANVQSSLGRVIRIGGKAQVLGGSIRNVAPKTGPVPFSIGQGALVKDQAVLRGYCQVFGMAKVYEYAVVEDHVKVFGQARVHGHCSITGDAVIRGTADISGNAVIRGGIWDGSEGKVTSGDWLAPGQPNPDSDVDKANYHSFQDRAGPSYRRPELEEMKKKLDERFLTASDKQLRTEVIKLAHSNPELREHLLPILREADDHEAGRKWDGKRSRPDDAVPYNKHKRHPPAGADGSAERTNYNRWYRENVCPDHENQCGLNEPGQSGLPK